MSGKLPMTMYKTGPNFSSIITYKKHILKT